MARGARGKEASKRHKEQRERDPAVLKRRAAFVHREVHEAQERCTGQLSSDDGEGEKCSRLNGRCMESR